jgi:hypothetical protein
MEALITAKAEAKSMSSSKIWNGDIGGKLRLRKMLGILSKRVKDKQP